MGIIDVLKKMWDGAIEFVKNVIEIPKDVVETISEVTRNIADSISEGRWIEAIEAIGRGIVDSIKNFTERAIEGIKIVTDVGFDSISEVIDTVEHIVMMFTEFIEEYPADCLKIAVNLIGAGICFVTGNWLQGAILLAKGIYDGVSLYEEKIKENYPEKAENYKFSPKAYMIYEKFKGKSDEEICEIMNSKLRDYLVKLEEEA